MRRMVGNTPYGLYYEVTSSPLVLDTRDSRDVWHPYSLLRFSTKVPSSKEPLSD